MGGTKDRYQGLLGDFGGGGVFLQEYAFNDMDISPASVKRSEHWVKGVTKNGSDLGWEGNCF